MADSDEGYDGASDDDIQMNGAGPSGKGKELASRPKGRAQATWEAGVNRGWELQETADDAIDGMLGGIEEASKRKR